MKDSERKAMFAKKYSAVWDRVHEKDGKKRIVGYKGGDTFDEKSIKTLHPDLQDFVTYHNDAPDESEKIRAVSPLVARHLADKHWIDKNYKLLHHKQSFHEV